MVTLNDLFKSDPSLYRRMMDEAARVCRGYARTEDDLDEMLGEAWLRAVKSQHSLRSAGKAVPWFITLARRTCVDVINETKKERERSEQATWVSECSWGGDATPVLDQQLADEILSLEDLLSADERRVFFPRSVFHRSFKEIASSLHITESAARQRFKRARMQLTAECMKLLADYSERDEPDELPEAMRITTRTDMLEYIAEMKVRGVPLTEEEIADLMAGLPSRRR